ncbi:MAG: hypothetical protein IJ035_06370 [Oscillospiraceae bacterium]|nr:hypothetical protein [Oscillospiraceae bacterium]
MKKLLSVLAALAVAVGLSGCQAGQTDTVVSETTQIEITTQTEKDYSDYEEFPERWSAERVLNMISIDGHQLSFPCTVDDILALSEDFEIEEYERNDFEKTANLYYKNIYVGFFSYYNDGNIYFFDLGTPTQTEYLRLEKANIQNDDEIQTLFETLMENPSDTQQYKFIDNKIAIRLLYLEDASAFILSWEEIE